LTRARRPLDWISLLHESNVAMILRTNTMQEFVCVRVVSDFHNYWVALSLSRLVAVMSMDRICSPEREQVHSVTQTPKGESSMRNARRPGEPCEA
jgi:hypothetical protein